MAAGYHLIPELTPDFRQGRLHGTVTLAAPASASGTLRVEVRAAQERRVAEAKLPVTIQAGKLINPRSWEAETESTTREEAIEKGGYAFLRCTLLDPAGFRSIMADILVFPEGSPHLTCTTPDGRSGAQEAAEVMPVGPDAVLWARGLSAPGSSPASHPRGPGRQIAP